MTSPQKILLVDDHGNHAEKFLSILDDRPRGTAAMAVPQGDFQWRPTPRDAVRFLHEEAATPEGWHPDLVLIDFAFEGTAETGLWVAAVAHELYPRARLVAFSGQDVRHGRWLFHAALHQWFGVRTVLQKNGPSRSYADLIKGSFDPTPRAVALMLAEHADLIDLFFYLPATARIFGTWRATHGERKAVRRLAGTGSDSSTVRRLDELAQVAATFNHAFGLDVFGGTELKEQMTPKERLAGFMAENRSFFEEPHLPEILGSVAPWQRVTRADLVARCENAGYFLSST